MFLLAKRVNEFVKDLIVLSALAGGLSLVRVLSFVSAHSNSKRPIPEINSEKRI